MEWSALHSDLSTGTPVSAGVLVYLTSSAFFLARRHVKYLLHLVLSAPASLGLGVGITGKVDPSFFAGQRKSCAQPIYANASKTILTTKKI